MDLFPNSLQKSRHRDVFIRSVCVLLHKDISTAEMSLLSPQSCLLTLMERSISFFQEPERFHHVYQNDYFFRGCGCERSASP